MDFKQIQELIKTVNRSNIGEISVEDGEFKITIKQKEDNNHGFAPSSPAYIPIQTPAHSLQPPPQQIAAPQGETSASSAPIKEAPRQAENTVTIKSPMIGTFYRSSSPDKPPFASVGDEITVGSKVCIIEAMKLFNEIDSEVKGTIVKVLVDDASPVE